MIDDLDVDRNFFASVFDPAQRDDASEFYHSVSFHEEIASTATCNDSKIFHLNVRSVPASGDALSRYLETLKLDFDIICWT